MWSENKVEESVRDELPESCKHCPLEWINECHLTGKRCNFKNCQLEVANES